VGLEGEICIRMKKLKIVADDRIPFLKGLLEEIAYIEYLPGKAIDAAAVKDADALLVRTRTPCDRKLLEGSRVSFIGTATIGFDHIDTEYCEKNGITWTNAPGCNAGSVEQYIVSVILSLVQAQKRRLRDLTIGVIGVGHVGSKVARAAGALGMKVLLNDPPRERKEGPGLFTSLNLLLEKADIVSLHVPLSKEGDDRTSGMADAHFLGLMKEGAILINSSRGGVVDEQALRPYLKKGKFSAVVLDVFSGEPEIDKDFLSMLTLATPHIAGYSTDGKANGTAMVVQALSRKFMLGLDNWRPKDVPLPAETLLMHDPSGYTLEESLAEIYLQTYDVKRDHTGLLAHPEHFEQLRGAYPLRREAVNYTVRVFTAYPELSEALNGLGFNVLGDSCF